jgi:hypothetical protein
MEVLWQAYPGKRGDAYPRLRFGPTIEPLTKLEPNGRAFYAFAVARVIRSATLDWYNAQTPSSHDELMDMKSTGRGFGASAYRWASHAMEGLSKETLPPSTIQSVFEDLKGLMAALQRDAEALA